MEERTLFDQFHEALDIEPRAGAYDRLRIALAKSPVKAQRHLAFPTRWSKTGLRLAAVATLLVIAIAATAAFLASRRVADRISPADSDHAIAAYKLMVADDYTRVTTAAATWTCDSGDKFAACEADGNKMLPAASQFLDDLNRYKTPARFAVADAQLRRHMAAQTSRTYALVAASRAHDAAGAGRARAALVGETGANWVAAMYSSILRSNQGTAAAYVESVRYEKQFLDGCSECQDLAGQKQISCAGSQASTCQELLDSTVRQVRSLQTAVILTAAPSSLAAKDNRLQLDLAKADTALITMADALSAGDQAGFDAGRSSLQQAMPAVNRDVADIVGS